MNILNPDKLKLVLVSPKGPLYRHRGGIFRQHLRYAPLTLTTLAALVPPEIPADIQVIDEGIEDLHPEQIHADLVGITLITGNAVRAYELADRLRARRIPVVLGGPHVTLIPNDAQSHADTIVVGYAEETWPQLLRDFVAGQMKPRYIQSPNLKLDHIPFPRRDLLKGHRYLTTHIFEATRSCIHTCEFCVAPAAWGTKPYLKPVDDVVADIRQHYGRIIGFIDLNMISDQDYAAQLFQAMIPLKVKWFGLVTTLLMENRPLFELAVHSGCRSLLMGFETLSPTNLRQTRKGFNSPEGYREITETLHRHGVTLMACFTFGLDDDTPDVFMRTAQFAVDARIDLPRYAIVTPFPGTLLHKRLESEGRILTKNWELYDAQHVVFQPKQMTVQQLYAGHEQAWKYTYSASSIFRRLAGSRLELPIALIGNLGYRYYAHHLHDFYNCDWIMNLRPQSSSVMTA